MNKINLFDTKESVKIAYATDGSVYGFDPCNFMFGYTYHAQMIPPFKPEQMLILGYGIGTIAGLTRKIWGDDVKITGVDIAFNHYMPYIEYKLLTADAERYVLDNVRQDIIDRYDYIVIDLYNGKDECGFMFREDFAEAIKKMCRKLVSINCKMDSVIKLKSFYDRFNFDRQGIIGNQAITYWRTKE